MMILGFLIIGYLIYLVINNQYPVAKKRNPSATSSNAIEIAKSRLAAGEITYEEFEQIKKKIL
ncbi:SHOCT domain-containing protein [Cytobacillus sp. IB215665]|uniref:SHOCT domain-containing protein n=1 Tax=Cytobacillus sp. IB215665 TaxID=3097357 RepID=UPI002A16D807|nr:SHOCT domain-containing protein [Cytobacillus sp. IB215665]MDX8368020.1 SHOCT domain-containing protein [Cytobacillus sp. IB215665]